MGQKDGSQMRVPFGLDEHGNAVWADQIPYDRNGFKCALVCPDPNCGKRLKAVRWSKDDPERGIHYLAHEANSRCAVESNPESLLHLEAKAVLKGLIGHDFYLPNLSLIDSVPHTSRYRNAGKLEFKKYGKLTVLPVPGSSVLKFSPETYKSFIPGTGCMTKIEDVKTERDCGAMCPEGLIPDAVALLSHADTEIWVAIEFRVSHPKAIEDVRKYATVDFPVMEISITDIFGLISKFAEGQDTAFVVQKVNFSGTKQIGEPEYELLPLGPASGEDLADFTEWFMDDFKSGVDFGCDENREHLAMLAHTGFYREGEYVDQLLTFHQLDFSNAHAVTEKFSFVGRPESNEFMGDLDQLFHDPNSIVSSSDIIDVIENGPIEGVSNGGAPCREHTRLSDKAETVKSACSKIAETEQREPGIEQPTQIEAK